MNNQSIALLDTVIITVDLLEYQVLAGDLSTIVEIYDEPTLGDDVEFVNPDGSTRALLTVYPEQVRSLMATDVLTTRQISLAA